MKKPHLLVLAFGILFLFIIQSAGTLVESIYILDLMNSRLDEKALGVLFFFAPLLLLPFFRYRRVLMWVLFALLFISRGLTATLGTTSRLAVSGVATVVSLSLFFLLVTSWHATRRWASAGLALGVGLSVLLRAVGHGLEYSLTPAGGWAGWLLGLLLGFSLWASVEQAELTSKPTGLRTSAILSLYLVLTLVYFSISAPSVIARWTQGNYTLIAATVSLFSLTWVWVSIYKPGFVERISPAWLAAWNVLFTLSLTLTLLAQRVPFPPTPTSPEVVVGAHGVLQLLPLGLMLLLFPVLFLDLQVFLVRGQPSSRITRSLVGGILLGSFVLILLVFINIFTNVWGYIEPISPVFRNTFWLAFFILSALISLLAWRISRHQPSMVTEPNGSVNYAWTAVLAVIFVTTLIFALPPRLVSIDAAIQDEILRVMTFNTQQSNDDFAEKSFAAQLALIHQVDPDILAMQETDSTRISLNNNDYVRYFADNLGYYSYYGPTTGTGTFGTAILSKFPLQNPRSVFIYSDKDETGVAEAEVEVAGMRFTIYNVHPDSSDEAMLIFAQTLLRRAQDKPYVIALGDFNLRDYEAAYQLIDAELTNAWVSVYPSEISPDGMDMSGENRIDHIFLSPNLAALNPMYILPPESATDHPVHWTDVMWTNP